ncbi:hypothetical protein HDU98_007991 [Podochytrium sp. JEL0797]|nr:hypothetical protein HDU98_007991 [Podochytrium sp. JEL0797]
MHLTDEAHQLLVATVQHYISLQTNAIPDWQTGDDLGLPVHFCVSGDEEATLHFGLATLAAHFCASVFGRVPLLNAAFAATTVAARVGAISSDYVSAPFVAVVANSLCDYVAVEAAAFPQTIVVATQTIERGRVLALLNGTIHCEKTLANDHTRDRFKRDRRIFHIASLLGKHRTHNPLSRFDKTTDFCIEVPEHSWIAEINDTCQIKHINNLYFRDPLHKRPNIERLEIKCLGFPFVFLVASTDIQEGDELLMNYTTEEWNAQNKCRNDYIIAHDFFHPLEPRMIPALDKLLRDAPPLRLDPTALSTRLDKTLTGKPGVKMGRHLMHHEAEGLKELNEFCDIVLEVVARQSTAFVHPLMCHPSVEHAKVRENIWIGSVVHQDDDSESNFGMDALDISDKDSMDWMSVKRDEPVAEAAAPAVVPTKRAASQTQQMFLPRGLVKPS